jgi:heme-degrading monooxygenase HmoA
MYATLAIGIAVPGSYEQMNKIAEQNPAYFKGKKGFKSAVAFSDKSRNEYGLMTIWETKEDSEAYWKSKPIGQDQRLRSMAAGILFEQRGFYVNNLFSSD